MKKLNASRLKMQAGHHYQEYHKILDDLSCGKHLGEHISGRATNHKIKFNEIMDKLATIDPDCPKHRL